MHMHLTLSSPINRLNATVAAGQVAAAPVVPTELLALYGLGAATVDSTLPAGNLFIRTLEFLITASFSAKFPTDDLKKAALRKIFENSMSAKVPTVCIQSDPTIVA
jgi:hypothetical protein